METIGVSPKVKNPVYAMIAAAVVLIVVGAITETQEVLTAGLTLLGAAPVAAKIGYESSPGVVDVEVGASSDDKLAEAIDKEHSEVPSDFKDAPPPPDEPTA